MRLDQYFAKQQGAARQKKSSLISSTGSSIASVLSGSKSGRSGSRSGFFSSGSRSLTSRNTTKTANKKKNKQQQQQQQEGDISTSTNWRGKKKNRTPDTSPPPPSDRSIQSAMVLSARQKKTSHSKVDSILRALAREKDRKMKKRHEIETRSVSSIQTAGADLCPFSPPAIKASSSDGSISDQPSPAVTTASLKQRLDILERHREDILKRREACSNRIKSINRDIQGGREKKLRQKMKSMRDMNGSMTGLDCSYRSAATEHLTPPSSNESVKSCREPSNEDDTIDVLPNAPDLSTNDDETKKKEERAEKMANSKRHQSKKKKKKRDSAKKQHSKKKIDADDSVVPCCTTTEVQNMEWTLAAPLNQRTGSYSGSTLDGKVPHGIGTLRFGDGGGVYHGPFRHGLMHGSGATYESPSSGTTYQGQFKHNQKHGRGEEVSKKSGRRYVGGFQQGRPHGFGVQYKASGSVTYLGQWVNGKEVGGKDSLLSAGALSPDGCGSPTAGEDGASDDDGDDDGDELGSMYQDSFSVRSLGALQSKRQGSYRSRMMSAGRRSKSARSLCSRDVPLASDAAIDAFLKLKSASSECHRSQRQTEIPVASDVPRDDDVSVTSSEVGSDDEVSIYDSRSVVHVHESS